MFRKILDRYVQDFEDYLILETKQSQKQGNNIFQEAMYYSLRAGGKRLRPVLCLAGFDLELKGAEPSYKKVLPWALALEMIHTFSLIQDDLPAMDNDLLRRGKPTNHTIYGEAGAMLASDALLIRAMQIMNEQIWKNEHIFKKACRASAEIIKASGNEGLLWGQWLDLAEEGKTKIDINSSWETKERLEKIHQNKTGALIRASVVSGMIIGGASDTQLKAGATFGENLGLSFQIIDDILDITSNIEELGKTAGKDLIEGKITFPAAYGLDRSKKMAQEVTENAIAVLENAYPLEKTAFLAELARKQLSRAS